MAVPAARAVDPPPVPDPGAAGQAAAALLGSLSHPDPYPAYARLRALAPVHVPGGGPVLVTSYAGVQDVLHTPLAGKDSDVRFALQGMPDWREHTGLRLMFTSILQLDGADHARLRGLVSRVFTARRVAALRPAVRRIAAELTDRLRERAPGPVDLVAEWALPLPVNVIGDLLGVPQADRVEVAGRVTDFGLALEPALGPAELARCDAAGDALVHYFTELVAERRRRPQDDLTSALAAEVGLPDDELLAMLALVFAAGYETTTQLLAKSVVALSAFPDQLAWWRADPALGTNAVEELLRFDSPVQLNSRLLRGPLTVDGVEVPGGRVVFCLLGAANRDPVRFPDPDRLDLARPAVRSMIFGGGPHFCLGAALARMEAAEALPRLFQSLDVQPVGRPEPRPGLGLHGYARLPVAMTPAACHSVRRVS